ncbi:MAG: beta-ketoacyl-[acyl-carrier-protein] synthase family protein [Oligoflexia bacterium]|nr:beta-ketoacyl-[acyl-carrier-protein] synthase family protein [Oligoflexia bacterium]
MRACITGMGAITSLGLNVREMYKGLQNNDCNIKYYEEWKQYNGLNSFLGAPVPSYDIKYLPREVRRSMSRMSEMAFLSTIEALKQANIDLEEVRKINTDRVLLIMGSTTGSPACLEEYYRKLFENNGPKGQLSTSFFKVMGHSVAANVALGLGLKSPMISCASACSTSSHAVILGMELIKTGLYDMVIAGGADELHYTSACVFDTVKAACTQFMDRPQESSRPFDKDRAGLVVSEGASTIIIESMEHASKRGVEVHAELLGGAYYCDGTHMSQPQQNSMMQTMKMCLNRAGIPPSQVDYINAHATATSIGDIEESNAVASVFGNDTPVSSLKGHLGHSLAACGGLELIASVEMIKNQEIIATKNLIEVDSKCAPILLLKENEKRKVNIVLSNNFAFGGMNTSLIVSRPL